MDHEKIIRDSISQAIKDGWHLIRGEWGISEAKCACGLSCVLVANNVPLPEDDEMCIANMVSALTPLLGVDSFWVEDFTLGFDGEAARYDHENADPFDDFGDPVRLETSAYCLGRKLGKEFFPDQVEE
jgi:hypothetical protein